MKTIQEIYKVEPMDLTEVTSSLLEWYNKVVQKTEKEVDLSDVLRMLRQKMFLETALKKAFDFLNKDYMIGEYYDAELLVWVMRLEENELKEYYKDLKKIYKKILSDTENKDRENIEEYVEAVDRIEKML